MKLHIETDDGKFVEVGKVSPRNRNADIGALVKRAMREAGARDGWYVLWRWCRECLIEKIESADELPDDGNQGESIAAAIRLWPESEIREMTSAVLSSDVVCESYHEDVVAILNENKSRFDPLVCTIQAAAKTNHAIAPCNSECSEPQKPARAAA